MEKKFQEVIKKIMEQKQKDWEKKPKMSSCVSGNKCLISYDKPKIIKQINLPNEQGVVLITKEQIDTALALFGMYNRKFQIELFIIKKNKAPKPIIKVIGRDNQGGAEIKIKKIKEKFVIVETMEEYKTEEIKIDI